MTILIPRVFHRIWFGGPMPTEYVRYGQTWLEHHPGWKMNLWTEENLPQLSSPDNFHKAKSYSEKSDFLRHDLLTSQGGVYLDTDFECLKCIEPLIEDVEAFAASEDGRHISCGIMGCVPGHPFFCQIAESLAKEWRDKGNASKSSGPMFVTRIANRYNLRKTLKVFEPKLFYPGHYRRGLKPADCPHAYAIHHWGASWCQ